MPALLPGPGEGRAAAMLGVMGGGQLARMFVHAAQAMGFATAVLDPDADSPAGRIAHRHVRTAFDDAAGLEALGRECAAVTTEFENVPAASLALLARHCTVTPSAEAVAVCQRRDAEKAHFASCGVPCAPHAVLREPLELADADAALFPAILKTAQLGYDGKGQLGVDRAEDLSAAWQRLGGVACVVEKRLPLRHEISVIVARSAHGACVNLPVQHNLHRGGILAVCRVPAPGVDPALQAKAVEHTRRIAAALGYVGVLCVEFFVLDDGTLVANEMAPRPHNSGHYSIDACDVSQFELQVRCLAGLPLVQPRQHSAAVMLNLLGELWFAGGGSLARSPDWARLLALPGVHLHLYGKAEPRVGRKMGHLSVTAADADSAVQVAQRAAELLGLQAF